MGVGRVTGTGSAAGACCVLRVAGAACDDGAWMRKKSGRMISVDGMAAGAMGGGTWRREDVGCSMRTVVSRR